MTPARVIGAGLSGLVAAWHLADRGCAVTVYDRAPRAGGLIDTIKTPHGLVETAANAFVWNDTVAGWFSRLGLEPVFPRPSSKRRYIFRAGASRRWPLTMAESAALAYHLGRSSIARTLRAGDGETMAAWGHRVLGEDATRWLLEPAMQGVYAASARCLSARAIFDGRRRGSRLAAPAGGMGEFTTRLFELLRDRGVIFEFNHPVEAIDAAVPTVIATNAAAAARLLERPAPQQAAAIAAIRVAPLATVTMFFEPQPADVRGFGVLFPERSGVAALGVLFNADIFEGRSRVRSETWIVGDRGRGLTALPDQPLLDLLAHDRHKLCGRHAPPLSSHITRWPQAIPVYDQAIVELQTALPDLPPGLALTGNYLGRIGVAALLSIGDAAADRALRGSAV